MGSAAIGIDLGGTQIKAVLVEESGEVSRREVRPTNDGGLEKQPWARTIHELVADLGDQERVGISAPGLASRDRRSIAFLPGRLLGLEGFNWTEYLARKRLVPVLNDAHASLAGEAWIGAARGLQNAIMLTLGTGVGGAILAEGRVLRGHIGRAGHLGHTCLDMFGPRSVAGMPGALECFIGNYNIHERTGGKYATTHELIAAVAAGDEEAGMYWMRSIRALACATASFINVLDPEAVIIGGGIATAADALFAPLQANLDEVEWRPGGQAVRLLPAALGEWAGAIGAAREAMEQPA